MYAMFFYVLQRSTLPSIFDCRGIYMCFFFFFETLESKSLVCAFFFLSFFHVFVYFLFLEKLLFFFLHSWWYEWWRQVNSSKTEKSQLIAPVCVCMCVSYC